MIDLINYVPSKHKGILISWLRSRKLPAHLAKDMPEFSYVAVHGEELIAVAGLDAGDSVAVLIGLCTNPMSPGDIRSLAIDALTKQIIQDAKEMGFQTLLAWTTDNGILERSFSHGFKQISNIMMSLHLGGD